MIAIVLKFSFHKSGQFFLRFHLAAHSQILSALPSTGRFKGGHVSYAPYIDFIPNVTIICVM